MTKPLSPGSLHPALLLVLTISLLTGCAQYYIQTGQLDDQLDAWESSNQYQKAIEAIEQLPAAHPHRDAYEQRESQLRTAQKKYIHRTINEANALTRKRQWQAALELYQQALDGNPDQGQLKQSYDNIWMQRQIYNTKLRHQLKLIEASTLKRRLQLFEELARSNPQRDDYKKELETLQQQQQTLYSFLHQCAEDGLEFTNFTHGQRCLKLAQGIRPKHISAKSLELLSKRYQQLNKRNKNASDRRTQQQLSSLEQQYKTALKQQDYIQARHLLDQQESLSPDSSHLISTRLELEADIEEYVEQQMHLGAEAYSNGQIEQALTTWQPLLPLQPDNLKLQDQIQRAERFTRKLKTLQQSQ
ncbi:hypothetical protein MIB92_06040 [Aestuariirhabdus sp. Z084]|uniref:hypothetical protein n=1 Tax=Aestuariirhabdus haliotis TaxID=2918751 RepID=UPI00201B3A3D|nr:hypothetical protein [Aestuariirhabdus haliotis]MCL6415202.1 hypothetical protein [Aestuariirhabdus haliotis]MCL6420077.1 hypothetical protein [Aestuariirhabdus haliotis]